jgi:hypothetical protein
MINTAFPKAAVGRNNGRAIAARDLTLAHHVAGRLRLKLGEPRRTTAALEAVRRDLAGIEGATTVTANPYTGSIVIEYDPKVLAPGRVLKVLARRGYRIANPAATTAGRPSAAPWTDGAARAVGRCLVDLAAERVALALLGIFV